MNKQATHRVANFSLIHHAVSDKFGRHCRLNLCISQETLKF